MCDKCISPAVVSAALSGTEGRFAKRVVGILSVLPCGEVTSIDITPKLLDGEIVPEVRIKYR